MALNNFVPCPFVKDKLFHLYTGIQTVDEIFKTSNVCFVRILCCSVSNISHCMSSNAIHTGLRNVPGLLGLFFASRDRPLAATEPCDARPAPRRELPVISAHHAFEEWDEDSVRECFLYF